MILFLARHAAITALLAATAWAAGRLVLRRWAGPAPAALAVTVGMAALAQALHLVGLVGWLRMGPMLALAAAVHLLAIPEWRRVAGAWRQPGRILSDRSPGAVAAVALFAALLWALTLYPPIAFDETMYHLPFTRAFADTGALPFLPDLRFPVFPQLAEILALPLYVSAQDFDTHAISWLATLAVAGLLASWHGARPGDRAGELAAALWLGSPIVVYLSGVGYVEPLLALFVAGACYCYTRAERVGVSGGGWCLLAGFMAGSAASTKYHGLFFVAALGVAFLAGRRWRPLLLYGAAGLAALLPSYARIAFYTGNPLFPYYPRLFGANAWALPPEVPPSALDHPWGFLTLPWRVVFDRASIGGFPPHSPALLLAVPLAVYAAVREPRARMPLALAAGYALLAPMDARYLVAALPLLTVAAALAAAPALRSRARAAAAVLLLPGVLYAVFTAGRRGPLPATPESREHYLETWLPIYPAVRFLNAREPGGYAAWALASEEMVYWARGRWLGDPVGLGADARIRPLLKDPGALQEALLALEVRYLVVPRGRPGGRPPGTRFPVERFTPIYQDSLADIFAVAEPAAR